MESFDTLLLQDQLCFPLYACSREVIKKYHGPLKKIGLTYPQYITMMVLWEQGTISVRDLGKRLYLDSGTLTPLLKHLESKGLVTRTRSSEDERVLIVGITDEGEALKEKAMGIPCEIAACVRLTPEESQVLRKLLYKLLGVGDTNG